MKPYVIISTTETIEGMEIEKYYDLISTNVVLGTNILSDIGASFSDLLGEPLISIKINWKKSINLLLIS